MGLLSRLKEAKENAANRIQRAKIEGLVFIVGVKAATRSFAKQQVEIQAAVAGARAGTRALAREGLSDTVTHEVIQALEKSQTARQTFVNEVIGASVTKLETQLPQHPLAIENAQKMVGEVVHQAVARVAEGKTEVPPLFNAVVIRPAAEKLREELITEAGRQAAENVVTGVAMEMAKHPETVRATVMAAAATVAKNETRSIKQMVRGWLGIDKDEAPVVSWVKSKIADAVDWGTKTAAKVYATVKTWGKYTREAYSRFENDFNTSTRAFFSMLTGNQAQEGQRIPVRYDS